MTAEKESAPEKGAQIFTLKVKASKAYMHFDLEINGTLIENVPAYALSHMASKFSVVTCELMGAKISDH